MELNVTNVKELLQEFERSDLISMKVSLAGTSVEFARAQLKEDRKSVDKCELTAGKSVSLVDNHLSEESRTKANEEESGTAVKAPLAGIFYRAGKPGDKPFVDTGSRVRKGDTLGLIEAMKMVNEIKSPVDGVITEMRAEDGKFAEYGSVLMVIGKE